MQHYVEGVNDLQLRGVADSIEGKKPFLQYILAQKLATNLAMQRCVLMGTQTNSMDAFNVSGINNERTELEIQNLYCLNQYRKEVKELYEEYNRSTRTRRYSVDFDSVEMEQGKEAPPLELINNEDEHADSVHQLRKRLLGEKSEDKKGSNSEPLGKQIQVQDDLQKELVADMAQLVSSLKEGAVAFQSALQEDSTVLKATEIGLQVTSKSLSTLGVKLKKYHNSKVGFFFYMGCALFILLSFLATYLIIRIFPTM